MGATLMNQDSSRSHSIFTITIECIEKLESTGTGAPKAGGFQGFPDEAGPHKLPYLLFGGEVS